MAAKTQAERDQAERVAARRAALAANSPHNIEAEDSADPDVAFRDVKQPESAAELEAFADAPLDAPPGAFSKGGRDYYTSPAGKLVSVDAGFDTSSDYPAWKPATAEQVAEHELQKRKGNIGDKLDAFAEAAGRTIAEIPGGVETVLRNTTGIDGGDKRYQIDPEEGQIFIGRELAPYFYRDEADERRRANPGTATVGAVAADIGFNALLPTGKASRLAKLAALAEKEGLAGAAGLTKAAQSAALSSSVRSAFVGGLTGAASDVAVTGEPFDTEHMLLYMGAGGVLEAVSHVQWGEVMRSLGKKGRSAVDGAVDAAKGDAVGAAMAEKDAAKKAALLSDPKTAEAIYERTQGEIDRHLEVLDERVASAPDKMFTPSRLKKSVSANETAQGERYLELAVKVDQAAQVVSPGEAFGRAVLPAYGPIQQVPEALAKASELLGQALGESGARMFGALREARTLLAEAAGDSPLAREALEAIEGTLKDESLWGKAAKDHAQFSGAVDAGAPSAFKVDDISTHEALDAKLDQARRVAAQTGDKKLAAAVKGIEKALVEAAAVTGSKLMGPLRGLVVGALESAAKSALEGHAAKTMGGLIGGAIGGAMGQLPGMIAGGAAGTIASNVMAHFAAPHIEKLAARLAGGRARNLKLGKSWTKRIYEEAKAAAKKSPGKTALGVAAVVGAGAAGVDAAANAEQPGDVAAASAGMVGLLAAFLPKAGRKVLARELGEKLGALTARERLHLRIATERTAHDTEAILRRYAMGETSISFDRHTGLEPVSAAWTFPLTSVQDVIDAQHTIQLEAYAKHARIKVDAGNDPVDAIGDYVKAALEADLRLRNAAIIGADKSLERLAKPGLLHRLPEVERLASSDALIEQLNQARAALQEGDLPGGARSYIEGERSRLARGIEDKETRVSPEGAQDDAYHRLGRVSRWFSEYLHRPPNAREIAYAEAALRQSAEEVRAPRAASVYGHRRDQIEGLEGGPLEERLQRAVDAANRNVQTTADMPNGASVYLREQRDRLAQFLRDRGQRFTPQDLEREVQNQLGAWQRRVDREWEGFDSRFPHAAPLAEAELRLHAHQIQEARSRSLGPRAPDAAPPPESLARDRSAETIKGYRDYLAQMGAAAERGDVPARGILEEQLRSGYFGEWQRMASARLGRELSEEELAWGRASIQDYARELLGVEHGGTRDRALTRGLRVKEGEGQPVTGAPEFRRLGLPEPTQGDVAIDKTGPTERGPLRVEGDYRHPLSKRDARQQARNAANAAAQDSDFPGRSMTRLLEDQERTRERLSFRKYSDEGIDQFAQRRAKGWAQLVLDEEGVAPNAQAIEYARRRFEGQAHAMRAEELRERPLDLGERVEVAVDALHEDDMTDAMADYLAEQRSEVMNSINADTTPEEILERVRRLVENFGDKFVVSAGRPASRRARAYAELSLLQSAESRRQYEVSARREVQNREKRAAREAEEREAQRARRAEKQAREGQRVEELMNGLDLPEERQEALAKFMDEALVELNTTDGVHVSQGPSATVRQHGVDAVIDRIRERHPEMTPGEEVFFRDQLNDVEPIGVRQELRDEVDRRVAMDDSMDPTDSTPDLELDDLMDTLEQQGGFSPWEEYHLRREWQDHGDTLTREYEEAIDQARRDRKQTWLDENPSDDLPDIPGVYVHGNAAGVDNVFGQDLDSRDWEEILGLGPLEDLEQQHGLSFGKTVNISRDEVHYEVDGDGMDLRRQYRRTSGGFEVYHDHLFLPRAVRGEKFGMAILRSMFKAYERLGAVKVSLSAADVGKYVWLMLGFKPPQYAVQEGLQTFFRGTWRDTYKIRIPTELLERLERETTDLQELTDLTVPLAAVEHNRAGLESRYGERIEKPLDFGKTFIRGDEFKLGKWFLLTQGGSWNSSLSVKIDRNDPNFLRLLERIGLTGLSALGFQELMSALGGQKFEVQTEPDAEDPEAALDLSNVPVSAAEDAAQQETRTKLAYVSAQGRSLVTTTARALVTPSQKDRVVPTRPGLSQSVGVANFAGSHDNVRSAYEEKKQTLERIARDPLALVDEMADGLSDVSDASPELHGQLVGKAYEVLRYLQTKLPTTVGASLTRPGGTPPSQLALRQFALYYSAATNPSSVFADLANNRARKEQVDTLREVWPEQYQKLKLSVLEQLSESRPSVAQRSRLDLLFDFGESLDRAFSPRITQVMTASYQEEGPSGSDSPPGRAAPKRRTNPSITGASPLGSLQKGAAA